MVVNSWVETDITKNLHNTAFNKLRMYCSRQHKLKRVLSENVHYCFFGFVWSITIHFCPSYFIYLYLKHGQLEMARQRPTRIPTAHVWPRGRVCNGTMHIESYRIVIRDVQHQFEVNGCRNEKVNVNKPKTMSENLWPGPTPNHITFDPRVRSKFQKVHCGIYGMLIATMCVSFNVLVLIV